MTTKYFFKSIKCNTFSKSQSQADLNDDDNNNVDDDKEDNDNNNNNKKSDDNKLVF